jgi:hypothetical protein
MELDEDEDALPDRYLCEICLPENHKELLDKVARGEKPWEERAKEREREEKERKGRRRKGNKKGKSGRKSKTATDLREEALGDANEKPKAEGESFEASEAVVDESTEMKEDVPAAPAVQPSETPFRRGTGSKRKTRDAEGEEVARSESEKVCFSIIR